MMLRKWILVSVLCVMLAGCGGPWSSGDRVLVSKEAYDLGITQPQRYQVVVFKYPRGPMENNTPKNYIKRLLGLPGELIAIFFGRLYRIAPQPNEAPPFDDLKDGKVHPNDLWQHTHTNEDPAFRWFEEGKFEILRKPPHVMLALRRNVYDNDFQAKDLIGKLDRWSPDAKSSWKADKDRGFTHEGKLDRVDWLRYQHLLRPDEPFAGQKVRPKLISDAMDYNSFQVLGGFHGLDDRTPSHAHWVGDLMIECNLEVIEPKGEFWFELSKGIYRYQARWDLASGECTLFRIGKNGITQDKWDVQATRVKAPGNYLLRFANIDARLTVWVDRDLPFGDGKAYHPPEVRGPDDKGPNEEAIKEAVRARRGPTENDLEPASIASKGARVRISHVRLWRDTYYTTSAQNPDYERHEMPREAWSDPLRWEPIRKQHYATMYVQPGHYLCLGDNSQASSDGREWGLVPERLMLGRALAVYFPLERIGPIR